MKKKFLAVIVLMLLTPLVTSAETATSAFHLYLGAGLSVPSGQFGDLTSVGYHGSGAMGFGVLPGLELLPKIEFHATRIDEIPYSYTSRSGGNYRLLLFGGDGRYLLPIAGTSAKPYVMVGIGFANASISDLVVDGQTTSYDGWTELYYDLGAGIEFKGLGIIPFFFQFRYVSISTNQSNTTMFPLTFGIKF
ncbi:MAG: outer membrane beta-barrel protein [Candidatus Zixiibacteriota bacterium]